MAIAAIPDYLGKDFSNASPGLRFGMYLQVWNSNFAKEKEKVVPLKRAGKLNDDDKKVMATLLARQQASFAAISDTANSVQLDAVAASPFTTGLGNEHPLENGFAFLNPYGLPYLPGSGVKGVLRQAARELASGEWGDGYGWLKKPIYPFVVNEKQIVDNNKEPVLLSMLDVLFGKESKDGDKEHLRGALTFWDVIPQIKGDSLQVEIMTPHQKHYYQEGQNPHDSGQPIPISFLTVPPGSSFSFHVQCDLALLEQHASELAKDGLWQQLLQAAFAHAFEWLGFGAKTAVGYGAMKEDAAKKAEREEQLRQQQEVERRSTLSPEELAYEEHLPVIEKFREAFEQVRHGAYQPGQEFDSKRNEFIQVATSWEELRSRLEAAEILAETLKWGVSKKGKDRLKAAVASLKGGGG
ncbi:MAG: type III-B CRISPR module RAMP protein Cmr6 [Porticoccaceae bacterium]